MALSEVSHRVRMLIGHQCRSVVALEPMGHGYPTLFKSIHWTYSSLRTFHLSFKRLLQLWWWLVLSQLLNIVRCGQCNSYSNDHCQDPSGPSTMADGSAMESRFLSQTASQPEIREEGNEVVNPTFVNRNPRNLEQMALAVKQRGWKTTWPHREFYHRLVFNRTHRHVTAQVFSGSSPVPVLSCSTMEWAVKKELGSTHCVAACQAVGEVLAHRCHQAGITRMVYRAIPWTYRSDAVQSFRTAMKEGGITLSEPRRKYIGT